MKRYGKSIGLINNCFSFFLLFAHGLPRSGHGFVIQTMEKKGKGELRSHIGIFPPIKKHTYIRSALVFLLGGK